MSNLNSFDQIKKIIDRLEKRKSLFSHASEFCQHSESIEYISEDTQNDLSCNKGIGQFPTVFVCAVSEFTCTADKGTGVFGCKSSSGIFDCSTGPGSSYTNCTNAQKHSCNTNTYSGGCTLTTSVFECGSFECVPTPNTQSNFNCNNGYGCNTSKNFDCSSSNFNCTGSLNFICMSIHECKTNHSCGNTGTGKKFQCEGKGKDDNYDCQSNFTCANPDLVACPSGQYTCKNTVSCNPSGQPFTPPSPPEP
jgi:hypothetical protein